MVRTDFHMRIKKKTIRSACLATLMVAFLPSFIKRAIDIPFWGTLSYSLVFVCAFFFLHKMKHTTKPMLWTGALYGYLLLITVLFNTHQSFNCFIRLFLAVSMTVYIEYLFYSRTPKEVVSTLMLSMEIFNYLNLASMIVFPNGMYRVITNGIFEELVRVEPGSIRTSARVIWLAGHQTMMIRFTLPAIVIALVYAVEDGKIKANLRSLLLIGACIAETYIANSAGNYLILLLFVLILLLFRFHGRIHMWAVIPLIVILYTFFITSAEDLSILEWLSTRMHRSVQISTRIPVWLNTLDAWLQKPVLGYGYIEDGSISIRRVLGLGNPHSSYLWVLYEGGIVGIIILLLYILFWTKRKGRYWEQTESSVIYAGMICMLMCMIDDDHLFRSVFFLIIFELNYHIPELINTKKQTIITNRR